ncbi:MAG: hypothetical protein GX300_06145 [Tissierellia bacterium]|nr:hypothetical protein [Tissierellia bacterium]
MKKLIKILIIEVILIGIIFSFLLLKDNGFIAIENTFSKKIYEKVEEITIDKTKVYSKIEKALLEGENEVEFKDFSMLMKAEEVFSLLDQIVYENPKIMYYKGAEYRIGKLTISYSKTKEEIKKHQKEIEEIRDDFIAKYISNEMTDYEKVLASHDYIINNSRYDTRILDGASLPPESYTSYGVLKLGIGVCEGYAKAMKYLLDGIGIESKIVIGLSKEENHAWNLVKLDNEYYHIDATWDDPVTENGQDVIRYNYFNLNDEEISRTHSWKREDYPPANGRKYNYFIYNKLLVYTKNELEDRLRNAILNKESNLLIKIDNIDETIYLADMIESIAYDNFNRVKLKRFSFSIDKEYGIIYIEFAY